MNAIRSNVIFVLIFYVDVKNNTLTTLTLKMQRITKSFGKLLAQKFFNKCKIPNTIILVENENILLDEKAIASTFSHYFTDVFHSLGLKKKNIGLKNTLSKIMDNFIKFVSINKIKESQ